jgi:hypothetical protein
MQRTLVGSIGLLVLFGAFGCNWALDIDEAELVDDGGSAGGAGGSSGSGGSAGTGGATNSGGTGGAGGSVAGVCDLTGEACWDCTAGACCAEYADCLDDGNCSSALEGYNECLTDPPTNGSTCGEIHAATSSKFLALSQCVLLGQCAAPCGDYPLGTLCEPYCSCMASTCGDFIKDKADCLATCPSLSEEQIRCRSLHCTFASSGPDLHCPHAIGAAVCP